jgi:hypothetical protein
MEETSWGDLDVDEKIINVCLHGFSWLRTNLHGGLSYGTSSCIKGEEYLDQLSDYRLQGGCYFSNE